MFGDDRDVDTDLLTTVCKCLWMLLFHLLFNIMLVLDISMQKA